MKRGKRYLAALMIVAMVFANVGPGVWAALAGTEKDVLFEIEAFDLIAEIEEAAVGRLEMGGVEYESIDGEAGMFWQTFVEGGGVYELNPEIRGGRDGVGLRLFVRLPDLPDLPEESEGAYRVTGEEELLLLYTNETPDTVCCRVKVNRKGEDGGEYIRVTKKVALSGYQAFLEGEEIPEEESGSVQASGSNALEEKGPGDGDGGPGDEKGTNGSEAAGNGQETEKSEGLGDDQKAEEDNAIGDDRKAEENNAIGGDRKAEENIGLEGEQMIEEDRTAGSVDENSIAGGGQGPEVSGGPGSGQKAGETKGLGDDPEGSGPAQSSFAVKAVAAGAELEAAGEPLTARTEDADSVLKEEAAIAPENESLSGTPANRQEDTDEISEGQLNPETDQEDVKESPEGGAEQGTDNPDTIPVENPGNEQDTPGELEGEPEQAPGNTETEEIEKEQDQLPTAGDPVTEEGEAADLATGSNAEKGDGDNTGDKSQGIVEAGKATDSNAKPTATESNAGEYGEVSDQVGVDEIATARLCRMTLGQLIPSLEKQFRYEYEGEGIYVVVELPKDTKVPSGAKLWVEQVTEETDPGRLARRRGQFAEAYGGDGEALDLYDIGFYVKAEEAQALMDSDVGDGTLDGADTEEAEVLHQAEADPQWVRLSVPDEATIYIRFTDGFMEVENAVSVVRFGEESSRPRMMDILKMDVPYVNEVESLTFSMEDFSEFGIYKRGVIRHTGGAGTGLYRAAGMLLMMGAGWLLACRELYGKTEKIKED